MLIIYSDQIKIHDSSSFEGMRVVGKLAAELLDLFVHQVKPGITTDTLDSFAYEFSDRNYFLRFPQKTKIPSFFNISENTQAGR